MANQGGPVRWMLRAVPEGVGKMMARHGAGVVRRGVRRLVRDHPEVRGLAERDARVPRTGRQVAEEIAVAGRVRLRCGLCGVHVASLVRGHLLADPGVPVWLVEDPALSKAWVAHRRVERPAPRCREHWPLALPDCRWSQVRDGTKIYPYDR